jgi:hypothetical protein
MTTNKSISAKFLVFASILVHAVLGCVPAFSWQTTSKQPRSTIHLRDNSDWWSLIKDDPSDGAIKFQEREVPRSNFQILGIDLGERLLERATRKLGEVTTVERGDASTGRHQVCYVSSGESRNTYLIFETGEVNDTFYLFNDGDQWKGNEKCLTTKVVTSKSSTASGLQLGLAPDQVIAILGEPTIRRENELSYYLHTRKKTSEADLKRMRQQNREMSDKEFISNYGFYDLSAEIVLKFKDSKLAYLGVSKLETY